MLHFRYIILTLIVCLVGHNIFAQSTQYPQYIPGDSIVMWSPDGSDFRSLALREDATLKSREILLYSTSEAEKSKMLSFWENKVGKKLTAVGGWHKKRGERGIVYTCRTAYTAASLFLHHPHANYFDAIERILLNQAPSLLGSNTPAPHKAQLAQMLCDAAGWVYAIDSTEVYLNLFVSSTARITSPHLRLTIDQLTALPYDNRVKLRVSNLPMGKVPFTLRIRIPDWATNREPISKQFSLIRHDMESTKIYVNGREEDIPIENGYWIVKRKWNSGDEVFFDLPFAVRHIQKGEKKAQRIRKVALQLGPLVYAPTTSQSQCFYSTDTPAEISNSESERGNILLQGEWHYSHPKERTATFYAHPVNEGHSTIWMDAYGDTTKQLDYKSLP